MLKTNEIVRIFYFIFFSFFRQENENLFITILYENETKLIISSLYKIFIMIRFHNSK